MLNIFLSCLLNYQWTKSQRLSHYSVNVLTNMSFIKRGFSKNIINNIFSWIYTGMYILQIYQTISYLFVNTTAVVVVLLIQLKCLRHCSIYNCISQLASPIVTV